MIRANWNIHGNWADLHGREIVEKLGCEVHLGANCILVEFIGGKKPYKQLIGLLGEPESQDRVSVVNRSSWHYRLMAATGKVPESVCPYFWLLVGRILLFAAGVILFGGAGVLMLHHYVPQGSLWWVIPVGALIVPVGIFIVAVAGAVIGYLSERGSHSIVGEYIQAKKEKICPRIHFK